MDIKNKETKMKIEIDAQEKEMEQAYEQAKVPKFNITRTQKDIINKIKTPLWKFEELFINEQKARRNSIYTIRHYQRTFKKIYEFLAFTTQEDSLDEIYNTYNKDLSKGYDIEKHSPLSYYGMMLPIATLELDNIQTEFGNYLSDIDDVSEQTVISYFRDFRSIMYFAMDNGWIKRYSIVIKDREPPIKNCYNDSEIKRLLKKPDDKNFTEYRNWVIVNYLLSTGHRIQTIINLKVGDVDLDEGYINVNVQKNTNTRRITIINKLNKILKEYIAYYRSDEDGYPLDGEYLFCNRYGEQLTDTGLKKAIKNYNESRNVNKTSIHLFRHTFAKDWIMGGGDLITLQQMLGQSSLKMVQRYANLYATDLKDKAEEHALLAKTKTMSGETLRRKQLKKR
ncbi:site-specific integrase [bacterium]|nr:site-specific integrase [bacterium]